ncbi:hypothetical protein GCM10009623_21650 [Nocardioides aestuarii]|uniref:Uncharacterized protein n=1 Tax=Nocardioides aestuarii TaxID=252231 RepID=A0ABW4TP87_9ACTN
MYGDTAVIRRRVDQLREQGAEVRSMADLLVGRAEQVGWQGRAAEAMRERVRDRAAQLREAAGRHDTAADALERHLHAVTSTGDAIDRAERRVTALVAEARGRVERLERDAVDGVEVRPTDDDRLLLAFDAPPRGHRDWLAVELPGL